MSTEKIVNRIQNNRYFSAISTAFGKVVYLNVAVAAIVFVWFQFQHYVGAAENIQVMLILAYQYYCVVLALIFAYVISDELTVLKGNDHLKYSVVFLVGLLAVVYIPKEYTTEYPILAALYTPVIYLFLEKLSLFKIRKMKVLGAVRDYFDRLIPLLIMMCVVMMFVVAFDNVLIWFGNCLSSIAIIVSSPYFIILITVLICTFWIMGLHGVAVIGTLMAPFWLYMLLVNGLLILLGQPAYYIGSESFFQWVVWIGGSGCTLGLSISMRYFSKSSQLRTLGREVMTSNWFNINENVIFGVPIVGNKLFRIPFFLAPVMCALVGYSAFAFGYVRVPALVAPWVLPAPIGIFIATLGDFRSLVLIAILIGISALIYYPFFRIYDNELRKEEMN